MTENQQLMNLGVQIAQHVIKMHIPQCKPAIETGKQIESLLFGIGMYDYEIAIDDGHFHLFMMPVRGAARFYSVNIDNLGEIMTEDHHCHPQHC